MAEQIGLDRAEFRPSYRPERAQSRLDPDMKRMGLLAAALGGVIALFAGGTMLMRPSHHTVPVIEAEAGPVRIKPENPGGMQVSGADMSTPGLDQGPHLAAAAEQPELANLAAQVRQVKKELAKQAAENAVLEKQSAAATQLARQTAANAAHSNVVPAARSNIVPAARSNIVAAAAPVQQAAATARVAAPPHAANASGSNVQLAAFVDEPAARAEWEALAKRVPELLGGRQPEISRTDAGGRTMYRLRTGGFGTVADAASFCEKMKAHGEECSIGAF